MGRLAIASSNPTEALDITTGNAKVANDIFALGRISVASSNPTEALDITTGNAKIANDVFAMGKLAIASSNPTEALDITAGNAKVANDVFALGRISVASSNPTEALDISAGNAKVASNIYAMQRIGVGTSNPSASLEVVGDAKIGTNLEVTGNLIIQGTTTTVNSTTVNIADNIIRLNNGAAYTSGLQAGIEVNRGPTLSNYYFIFDEASQYYRIGLQGQLQTVATRDDSPAANSLAIFDSINNKYTACNTLSFANNMLNVQGVIQSLTPINANSFQGLNTSLAANNFLNVVLGQSNTPSNAALIRYTHQGLNNSTNMAQFGVWGFDHITCQANGMVGINNSNPLSRLDVGGSLKLSHTGNLHLSMQDGSGSAANAIFMDFNNANSTARSIIGLDGAGFRNNSAGALTMATWTNHDMLFLTNQVERMRITNTGNVGIGVTPSYPLDVRGPANAIITRLADGTTDVLISSGKRFSSNVSGWTTFDPNGGSVTNGVAFWDNLAVAGGVSIGNDATFGQAIIPSGNLVTVGNIGVGTSNPTTRLDVAGAVRIAHNQNLQLSINDTSGTSTNALYMDFNNSGTTTRGIVGLDGTGFLNQSAGSLAVATWTNNNVLFATNQQERMRLTSNGNFGVRTNNPQYPLHVSGIGYFPDGIISPGIHAQHSLSGGGTITWTNGKLLWSSRVIAIPVEKSEFGNEGYIDITCPTSGTITCFDSGNTVSTVTCDSGGIPMNNWFGLYYEVTPGQASASDASKFRLVHYVNSIWKPSTNWILIAATNWDFQSLKWIPGNAYLQNNSTFTYTGTGGGGGVGWAGAGTNNISTLSNIGVGIATPLARLHVAGGSTILDASTTGDYRLFLAKQNAANLASIIFTQGGNTTSQGAAEIGIVGNNSLTFNVNSTLGSYTTRMLISASNIGIGTTAPGETLHVAGKILANTQYLSTINDSVTVPGFSFREDSNTGIYHAATQAIGFTTNGIERMRIANAGVGINATFPANALDVGGWIRAFGNTGATSVISTNTLSAGFSCFQCVSDSGGGIIMFQNGSTRSTDGGTLTGTIRNDAGDLRLQATNANVGMIMKSTGNIGVHTPAPVCTLDVNGNMCVKSTTMPELRFINSNNMFMNLIAMATYNTQYSTVAQTNDIIVRTGNETSTARIHLQAGAGSAALTVNSNNFVGINTATPAYRFHVVGDIFATGDIMAFSDCNLKTKLEKIDSALDKISTLTGYTYERIDSNNQQQPRQAGLLAQDVIKVLPEVVHTDPSTEHMSIAYGNMAALFVEAIKEIKAEIDIIKSRIKI